MVYSTRNACYHTVIWHAFGDLNVETISAGSLKKITCHRNAINGFHDYSSDYLIEGFPLLACQLERLISIAFLIKAM